MAANRNEEVVKTQEQKEIQGQPEQSNGQGSGEEEDINQRDSKMEEKEEESRSFSKPSIEGASPGKIFVGGLPKDTTDEEFTKHFGKYGKIVDSVIMKHRGTGHPRGFGFITYEDADVVDAVIADTHTFEGKQVEIKRTIPKGAISGKDFQTKKIFVGGIPASVDEEQFKNFFSKFGEVEENLLMRDHTTGRSRGFGFIGFSTEKAVDDLLIKGNRIEFAGAQVEIKKAEPKKPGNAPSFAPPAKHYGTPKPAIGRGRGRGGFKDHYGNTPDSGPIRYGGRYGSSRAADYGGPYPSSEYDGGYGGPYPNSGIGSYRGGESLAYSGRYGSSLGRGYGYSEPSDSYYGGYGGAAGGYGGGAGGGYGGAGGYGGGAGSYGGGTGGYGGGGPGGYGGGGAGGYGAGAGGYGGGARRDYGSGGSGRYHPYGR